MSSAGARWNPCSVIRWRYNSTGAYSGSREHVERALARITYYTGLQFSYAGTTSYVPYAGGSAPSDADFFIGWANASQVSGLAGGVVGIGGYASVGVSGKDVGQRIVRGQLVLDLEAKLRNGFADSGNPTWGQVMMHEILHALGLGHASGSMQVMAGSVSPLNHNLAAGDITGMGRIGASNGCL